jgi:methyl-accepting chemotaxis protein
MSWNTSPTFEIYSRQAPAQDVAKLDLCQGVALPQCVAAGNVLELPQWVIIYMNRLTIKQTLIGIFLLIGLMGTVLVAYIIPSQIDTELTQRLDSDLLPSLRADMGGLSQQVQGQLQEKKKHDLERARLAFDREKSALARGLVARLRPMAEEYNLDGITALVQQEVSANQDLLGMRVRTEVEGEWQVYGELATPSAQVFAAEGKSDFAYVAIEMSFSTVALEQALKQEEASYATIVTNINNASDHMLKETEKGIGVLQVQMSEGVHDRISLLAIIVVVAIIAIMLLFLMLLDRVAIKPLKAAIGTLNQVAEGNMQVEIKVDGKNEVSQLLAALKIMVEKVRASIQQVGFATSQLASTAEQTSVITEKTNQAIRHQLMETTQVASAMGQMRSTVDEVSNNTHSTSQAAAEAEQEAAMGQRSMEETIGQIRQLASGIEEASAVLQQLEKHSEEIGGILDVIRGIAEQTNLLALNAAIEAARAGETGRGFAVVADEVRTLASRTQSSTAEIDQMIAKLQAGSRQAVTSMEQSCEKASGAVDQAQKTGQALSSITAVIGRINDMSAQIASASEEQSAVAGEINRNVMHINEMAEQTSTGAQQTAAASGELSRLAVDLKALVSQFRV